MEFGRLVDGSSHLNHSLYHDRHRRTGEGWKFTERVFEILYADDTALAGSAAPTRPGTGDPHRGPAPSRAPFTQAAGLSDGDGNVVP